MVEYEFQEETYTRVGLIILLILGVIIIIFVIDIVTGGKISQGLVKPLVCLLVYWTPIIGSVLAGYVGCGAIPL